MGANAEVVLRLRDAQAADDRAAIASVVHEDVVLHVPGHHQTDGDYVGLDGLLAFAEASRATGAEILAREVIDLREGRDHVVVYARIKGRRPGHDDLDNLSLHLYRLADGRVAEIWFHNRDQGAVDAFWG